jgi:transcriptional regulator GlxA family with amidase domain
MGALCTGTWVLAEAGLLDARRATIHWENQDGFAEKFPDVTLIRTVFVEDGNRLTAAGGTAAIDMVLRQIARDHGPDLANRIADQMIHTSIRSEDDHQRLSIPTRIGARHPRLAQVVARMEANIEEPVSPARLASEAGMSPRQLERLFARYLGRSPKRYYMEIRLERARNLLLQTEMSVMEIALACGFASAAHFSKCYRGTYGSTPYRQRETEAQPGS